MNRIALIFILPITLFVSPLWADTLAGKVVRLRGEVTKISGGLVMPVTADMDILQGDVLITGFDSRVEVKLSDETGFTLGNNSRASIDQFVYEPKANKANFGMTLKGGVFRMTTGLIGKKAPHNFAVRTPFATLGIRGTDFWGEQTADKLAVALLDASNGVTLTNNAGTVVVDKPNYVSVVTSADQLPSTPTALTAEQLAEAVKTIAW